MTLHEDVNRIQHGDEVTAEVRHFGTQYEITGPAHVSATTLALGPFAIAYVGDGGVYASGILLRVVAHTPKPAPLYTNRPDITEPRPYDVVAAENYPGGELMPLTYWNSMWRSHGGMTRTTEILLEVGPLTLIGEAIQ